jgi:4-hydroxy-tetrahydrodipicolinate synthase
MADNLTGIFPVLQTPFTASGEVDRDSLVRQVQFCASAGCHGVVYPVLGSEFQFLTTAERTQMVTEVVGAAAGRLPVVAGVAGASAPIAEEHARSAAAANVDAVIALPPYIAAASREEIVDYYTRVATAAAVPVFIQHSHAGMDAALLARLLREVEQIRYIKEEMHPSAHQISAVLAQVGSECSGVFGGAHGRWMLSELRRGASGFMPAVEAADVHVRIWETYQRGDEAGARRLFNALLPLINLTLILGLRVCKEVLVRRGVIATAAMRQPGCMHLDADDQAELDRILEDLAPLMPSVAQA